MLQNTEVAMKNGQSRETGNIGYIMFGGIYKDMEQYIPVTTKYGCYEQQ